MLSLYHFLPWSHESLLQKLCSFVVVTLQRGCVGSLFPICNFFFKLIIIIFFFFNTASLELLAYVFFVLKLNHFKILHFSNALPITKIILITTQICFFSGFFKAQPNLETSRKRGTSGLFLAFSIANKISCSRKFWLNFLAILFIRLYW